MEEMNKIRKGKKIESVLFIVGVSIWMITMFINEAYKCSVIENFDEFEELSYEMGATDIVTTGFVVILFIIAFACLFIGKIVGYSMCKCPKCGHTVMTRYGYIRKYCRCCGRKIVY